MNDALDPALAETPLNTPKTTMRAAGISAALQGMALRACLLLPLIASCGTTGDDGGGGGGGGGGADSVDESDTDSVGDSPGGGDSDSVGDSDVGGGPDDGVAWKRLQILDASPNFHNEEDNISAIYFSSLTTGFIGTRYGSASGKAALYKATAGEVTSFAVPDATFINPPGGLGDFTVRGIVPTTTGIAVTLSTSSAILTSTNDFDTFTLESSNLDYGIAALEGLLQTSTGFVALVGSGVVATSVGAPGPSTEWTERWAPEAIPTYPNPIPPGGCSYGPRTRINENLNQIGAISPNGQHVLYITKSADVDASAATQVVCVSHDGGVTFQSSPLAVRGTVDNASAVGPTAVTMVSDTVAFAAVSDFPFREGGTATIYKSTDSGETWAATTMPAGLSSKVIQIAAVFFAPGGTVGYAVGQNDTDGKALLLKTTDGGGTWVVPAGAAALETGLDDVFGSFHRLYTGFALDEDHLWVGGDRSALFYSDTGAN